MMWLKARTVAERSLIMDTPTRRLLHIVLFLIGLVLMVGGVAAGKPGASIVGLIVAAVNIQPWLHNRSGQAGEKLSE